MVGANHSCFEEALRFVVFVVNGEIIDNWRRSVKATATSSVDVDYVCLSCVDCYKQGLTRQFRGPWTSSDVLQ